mgnify:CR=1 FL=1
MKPILYFLLAGLITSSPAFAQKNAKEAELLKNQGNALYKKGSVDEAIELWKKAIEADSTYAEA